jgi:putative ABC transport system permease protein
MLTPWEWYAQSRRRGFSTSREVRFPVVFSCFIVAFLLLPLAVISGQIADQKSESSALTQVEVTPAASAVPGAGITGRQLSAIRAHGAVDDVVIVDSAGLYAGDGSSWSVHVRAANPAVLPPDVTAEEARSLEPDEVIFPSQIEGGPLDQAVGQNVPVEYTRMVAEQTGRLEQRDLVVAGRYDAAWQGYGPNTALASETLVMELLAARAGLSVEDWLKVDGPTEVIVTARDEAAVQSVVEAVRAAGLTAIPVSDRLGELPGIFAWFPLILTVVAVAVTLLLALQLARAVRSSSERRLKEFALLRTRGWSTADVRRLQLIDVALGTLIASALGTALGGLGGLFVLQASPTGVDTAAWWSMWAPMVGLVAVTVMFSVVVAGLTLHRHLTVDPYITVMSRARG